MVQLDSIKVNPLLDTLKLENIDDSVYFSEKYAEYISNSRLSLINPKQDGSPQKYFEGLANNKIYSDSLIFGSAVHELVLQPESFEVAEGVNRPTSKSGFIADLIYDKNNLEPSDDVILDAAKEVDFYKGNPSENQLIKLKDKVFPYLKSRSEFESTYNGNKTLIYLDAKGRERLQGCITALTNNKGIQNLLHPEGDEFTESHLLYSANEKTILLDVEISAEGIDPFIMRLKSKLDNFTINTLTNTITVNDVKTTGKMVNEFDDAVTKYHYFREMGMYSFLLSLCAKKYWNLDNPTIKSNFLVVSTIGQYYTKVSPMTRSLFLMGFNEFKYLLKLVAYYKINGY